MGIITRAAESFERREIRGVTLDPKLWRSITATGSASGVTVTKQNSLSIAAVYSCVRVLSDTLGMLPLQVFERTGDDSRRRAREHALDRVLGLISNDEMTAFTLRQTLQAHVLTWGNGFAEIESNGRGNISALWPLRPDKTTIARRKGRLYYITEVPASAGDLAGPVWLDADRVFHVHGLGFDGLSGYSPIALHRENLGLTKATEIHGARFFGNGARPGLILKHPGELSENAQKRLRESWSETHGGLDQTQRLAILEEGMDLETVGIPPNEAQFLETRQFQTAEIARIYRVPPHMIGDLERATFSNIEHQGIDFLNYSIGPWLKSWEQEIARQLLTEPELDRYYAEFIRAGIVAGDLQTRYEAYGVGRQNGFLSANDIRRLENMEPIGPEGDLYLVPLNMVPAELAGDFGASAGNGDRAWRLLGALGALSGDPQPEPLQIGAGADIEIRNQAAASRHRLMSSWVRPYEQAAGRIVRREANDITNAARRFSKAGALGEWELWLDEFYREFSGVIAGEFRPLAWSYGDLITAEVENELGGRGFSPAELRELPTEAEPFSQSYIEGFAARYITRSRDRIDEIIREQIGAGSDWLAALEAEFDQRRETKPASVAREESVRYNNALSVALYAIGGVKYLIWRAIGKSCPYCQKMNGRRIAIASSFFSGGETFEPEGADRPLKVSRKVKHAPLHRGCDCMVTAG